MRVVARWALHRLNRLGSGGLLGLHAPAESRRFVFATVALSLALVGCGPSAATLSPAGGPTDQALIETDYTKVLGERGSWRIAGGYESPDATPEKERRGGFFVARRDAADTRSWARHIDCSGDSALMALDVGPSGRTHATGWYTGALSWTEGASARRLQATADAEMFLVSLDAQGGVRWSASSTTRSADGFYTTGDLVSSLDDGSCTLAGNVKGEATFSTDRATDAIRTDASGRGYVARYTSTGRLAWVHRLDGSIDVERGAALATNTRGEVVVVGDAWHYGKSRSRRGIFVASYRADGSLHWLRHADGDGICGGRGAAVSPEGSRIVTGWFMGQIEFETGAGKRAIEAKGSVDLFVACFEPSGALRWLHTAGGEEEAYAEGVSVQARADGSLDVGAIFGGSISVAGGAKLKARCVDDELVARFDAEGKLLHARLAGRVPVQDD